MGRRWGESTAAATAAGVGGWCAGYVGGYDPLRPRHSASDTSPNTRFARWGEDTVALRSRERCGRVLPTTDDSELNDCERSEPG